MFLSYFFTCSRLLQLVDEKSSMKSHSSDPYSNENLAPFYRQPAAMRCVKRLSTKDDLGTDTEIH